jgi:uncharacterized protein DUF748
MRKEWVWITFGLVLLFIAGVSFYADTVLRDYLQRDINRQLKGYSVRIGAVSFHPIGFSLDLIDTMLIQNKHPDPPVMRIPRLHASVHWGALLHGRLVGDFLIERPKLYANLIQAKEEIKSKTPIQERGWQEALESIYPLKIDVFRVVDAEITYVDEGPFRPLRLSHLNLLADNIRNVHSPDHVYPSDIHLDGVVFDSGKIVLNGNANFLSEPHVGVKASLSLEHIGLDYFKPITNRYNLTIQRGNLSALGNFEYAPKTKEVDLQEISIRNADMEYVHKPQTAEAEYQTAQEVKQTAKEVANSQEILVRVDKVNILQSTFRFHDEASDPPYQVFLTDAEIRLANVSNQRAEGKATGSLKGKFMGSGDSTLNLAFWPEGKGLDSDLKVQIDGTEIAAMKDLLRAKTGLDFTGGQFSLYSEVNLRQQNIEGYIKPLFKDLTYDTHEPKKGFFQGLRQGLMQGLAKLLENRPRHEVATTVNFSGTLDDPKFSTWKAVGGLLRNAFLEPIWPGFEKKG